MTGSPEPADPAVVVFDDRCAFCSASARVGAWGDRDGRLRFVGASRHDELRACGIDPGSIDVDSIVVRSADGRVSRESTAIAEIVAAVPLIGGALAFALRRARPVADPLYRLIARHRHFFGGHPRGTP